MHHNGPHLATNVSHGAVFFFFFFHFGKRLQQTPPSLQMRVSGANIVFEGPVVWTEKRPKTGLNRTN